MDTFNLKQVVRTFMEDIVFLSGIGAVTVNDTDRKFCGVFEESL